MPEHIADLPPGAGPFPALIFAPGQRYHMRLPIPVEIAKQLVPRGIAVFRFDWSTPGAEADDLRAMLALVRSDARIDQRNIWVGGKSVGTILAWQLLAADPALHGAVLLTPICTPAEDGSDPYPGMEDEKRPLLLLSGDQDRLCETNALYRFAARAAGPVRVNVVSGGHDLGGESGADLAARVVADFLASHSQEVPLASVQADDLAMAFLLSALR